MCPLHRLPTLFHAENHMLKKVKGGYKVFTKDGSRALSKAPKSKAAAKRQLRAVEANKHRRAQHTDHQN